MSNAVVFFSFFFVLCHEGKPILRQNHCICSSLLYLPSLRVPLDSQFVAISMASTFPFSLSSSWSSPSKSSSSTTPLSTLSSSSSHHYRQLPFRLPFPPAPQGDKQISALRLVYSIVFNDNVYKFFIFSSRPHFPKGSDDS